MLQRAGMGAGVLWHLQACGATGMPRPPGTQVGRQGAARGGGGGRAGWEGGLWRGCLGLQAQPGDRPLHGCHRESWHGVSWRVWAGVLVMVKLPWSRASPVGGSTTPQCSHPLLVCRVLPKQGRSSHAQVPSRPGLPALTLHSRCLIAHTHNAPKLPQRSAALTSACTAFSATGSAAPPSAAQ